MNVIHIYIYIYIHTYIVHLFCIVSAPRLSELDITVEPGHGSMAAPSNREAQSGPTWAYFGAPLVKPSASTVEGKVTSAPGTANVSTPTISFQGVDEDQNQNQMRSPKFWTAEGDLETYCPLLPTVWHSPSVGSWTSLPTSKANFWGWLVAAKVGPGSTSVACLVHPEK